MGRLLQALECCCFDRGTKAVLRYFSDRSFKQRPRGRNLAIRYISFIALLIITLAFHCKLHCTYFKMNDQEGSKKRKGNIKCFPKLSRS